MDQHAADKLLDMLGRLYQAHEQLLEALTQQQQAIRRFDTDALEAMRDRCDMLAQRINELDEARVRMTGPNVRIAQIAPTTDEPRRSRLLAFSAGLKKLAEQIATVGRVNSEAVQNMLNHFHTVYQMLAGAQGAAAYGAAGQPTPTSKAFLVDAVA